MKENILIDKSIDFGARIVKLSRFLVNTKHENILSKQILRSGVLLLCKPLAPHFPDKSFSQRGIVQFEGYRSHRGGIVQFDISGISRLYSCF